MHSKVNTHLWVLESLSHLPEYNKICPIAAEHNSVSMQLRPCLQWGKKWVRMAISTRVHIAKPDSTVWRYHTWSYQEIKRVPKLRWETQVRDPITFPCVGKTKIINWYLACLSGCSWLSNEDADNKLQLLRLCTTTNYYVGLKLSLRC